MGSGTIGEKQLTVKRRTVKLIYSMVVRPCQPTERDRGARAERDEERWHVGWENRKTSLDVVVVSATATASSSTAARYGGGSCSGPLLLLLPGIADGP